mgnify:CR=1 FL=1
MNDESSETIPKGSTNENLEMVALFKFYYLKDPDTNEIRYIGRTVEEKGRLRNHVYEAKTRGRNKREVWILSLLRKNKLPILEVFYEKACNIKEASRIERILIKSFLKHGYRLKNEEDRGIGLIFNGRPVYQYTMQGDFIKQWPSAFQAQISTGVKDSNIGRCCKREQGYGTKSAGGYLWSFIKYDKYPIDYKKIDSSKSVYVFKDDTLIDQLPSARSVEKKYGVSYKHVSAICRGSRKQSKGYSFSFVS